MMWDVCACRENPEGKETGDELSIENRLDNDMLTSPIVYQMRKPRFTVIFAW